MSLWSWITDLFTGPAPWMTTSSGKRLYWRRQALPLTVEWGGGVLPWMRHVHDAIDYYAGILRARPALLRPDIIPAMPELAAVFERDPHRFIWAPSTVFLRHDHLATTLHAEHEYDPSTGEVNAARILLPPIHRVPEWARTYAVAHELGHVLCLDHSADQRSIMAREIVQPGSYDLTKREKERLRSVYE